MRQIFEILENDSKISPEKISTMTGIPVADVEKEIKKAEDNRTILKYKTVIDWSKLGENKVIALVEVKVIPQHDAGFDAIAERIYRFSQARSVYLASGTYDLAIIVEGESMHQIALFVSEKLAPMDAVQSTVTHFILKTYKEDGEVLEGGEGTKRLPITP